MIKTFKNKKEMEDYNVENLPSGEVAVCADTHDVYFKTNNVDGTNYTYRTEIIDVDYGVPDNEIWYKTTDCAVIPEKWCSSTAYDANLVSHTYENGWGKLVFDAPITKVNGSAISWYEKIYEIYLPNTITSIADTCFTGLGGLNCKIVLPHSLKSIGARNFHDLGNNKWEKTDKLEVDLSYTQCEEFGEGLFYDGRGIRYIKFPKCTKTLHSKMWRFFTTMNYSWNTIDFSLCEQIPTVDGTSLGFSDSCACTIVVPDSLYEDWIAADVWKNSASCIVKYSDWK